MTTKEEIEIVHGSGKHIVLLGAGASFASTLHRQEKNGKKLPLMKYIIEIVGLDNVVDGLPQDFQILRTDFEKLYSRLMASQNFSAELKEIEKVIHNYFSELELPDEPTIYDYLILSLRHHKDLIATFNWDPFLYKAYLRNGVFVRSPGILFLHGCVSIGYDESNGTSGPVGAYSKRTLQEFKSNPILFPVEKKDYNSNPYIKGQWDALSEELKIAKRVSVFGYSAPVSDIEAIELLKNAWGNVEDRAMEEFELIDIRKENEVKKSWDKFIHSHHYHYCTKYFNSSLAIHPRRTVESYNHMIMPLTPNEMFQDGNRIPNDFKSLEELWKWHKPLIEAEECFYSK